MFIRSRSQFRSARNDSELKLTMANRDKHGSSKGTDRTLTLTSEARRLFIEALLNPPKPNEKAIAAVRRLKEEIAWLADRRVQGKRRLRFEPLDRKKHDRADFFTETGALAPKETTLATRGKPR